MSQPLFLTRRSALGLAGETPRRGGQLTAVIELDARSLDPLQGSAPATDRRIFNLFAESLVKQQQDGTMAPWLAESRDVEDGGRTYVFRLRRDVLFQDGTPFKAQAAKFNLDRLLNAASPPPARQFVPDLQAVDIVDEFAIRVRLSQPAGAFLAIMSAEVGSMISPTAFRERGAEFARAPIGNIPPVKAEALYYAAQDNPILAA